MDANFSSAASAPAGSLRVSAISEFSVLNRKCGLSLPLMADSSALASALGLGRGHRRRTRGARLQHRGEGGGDGRRPPAPHRAPQQAGQQHGAGVVGAEQRC
jgi:hypothetical protein